jgi:hypothetical protein
MITIHKYELQVVSVQELELPLGAEILTVEALSKDTHPASCYNGKIFLWAKVDTDQPMIKHSIDIVGTSGACPRGAKHLGTVFMSPLVWHVFRRIPMDELNGR